MGQSDPKPRGGKALVLGDSTRSFLAVIRSLGRRGLRVHVAWCHPESAALRSRYIERVHAIAHYSKNDDRWKTAFVDLCCREAFDLIIPCHDDVILPLQSYRDELVAEFPIYLIEPGVQAIVTDKEKTHALAVAAGVPVPRQAIVVAGTDEALPEDLKFPMVLKPPTSVLLDDLALRHEVVKVYDTGQYKRCLRSLPPGSRRLAQEHLGGVGVGVEALAKDGDMLFAFQHIRIHERIGGGPSSYRRASPVDPELLDAARRMTRAMGYTGVAMFEFKKNFESGRWGLIEINGRFWGSLALPVAAGADFPFYLYQMLVEGRTDFSTEAYRADIHCRNLLLDLAWMAENAAADPGDATRNALPFRQVIREIRHVLAGRERLDTITLDDPLPGIFEIMQKARHLKHPARLWTI